MLVVLYLMFQYVALYILQDIDVFDISQYCFDLHLPAIDSRSFMV